MAKTQMKAEGFANLEKALRDFPIKKGDRAVGRAVREGAEVIAEEARAQAPRAAEHRWLKRGKPVTRLAESILIKKIRNAAGYAIGYAKSAFHGLFAELGTLKWGGHPFLRPALKNKADEAVDATREGLTGILERWRRRTRAGSPKR